MFVFLVAICPDFIPRWRQNSFSFLLFSTNSQTSDIQNKFFGPFQIFGSVRITYCFMKNKFRLY